MIFAALLLLVVLAALSSRRKQCVCPYHPDYGLFSNVMTPIEFMWSGTRPHIEFLTTDVAKQLFTGPFMKPLRGMECKLEDVASVVRRRFDDSQVHRVMTEPVYLKPWFNQFRRECTKYFTKGPFVPQPSIQRKARSTWDELGLNGKRVLGVHVRTAPHFHDTDFDGHLQKFIEETKRHATRHDHVFLFTNNLTIRAKFMVYQECVYRDVTGAVTGDNSDWDYSKRGTFELFEDALIDAILMSYCTTLVCGTSNMAAAALCMNPSMRCFVPDHVQGVISA